MNHLPRTAGCSAIALACLFAAGCGSGEQIHSYSIPKEIPPAPVAQSTSTDSTEPADRMLAAILPDGDKAWFFKVAGPIPTMTELEPQITQFFSSLRAAAGKPHPDWQLPEGWSDKGASGMRAATITIPAAGKPLDLAVSSLPWSGGAGELLNNVNRWRGQMQLAPIESSGLADCTHKLTAGDTKITVVDLQGRMQAGGGSMMAPFANAKRQQTQNDPSATANLPPNHPPIAQPAATSPARTTTTPFEFMVPKSWQPIPLTGMRKAAFRVAEGDKEATFYAMDFPASAGPMMADPLANVNRWRGEVGLPPLTQDELEKSVETIKVDEADAKFVEAIPDDSQTQADRATLAAMVTHNDVIWFFKLTGDPAVVAAQRDAFKTFLSSIKFTADSGTKDGH